MPNIIKTMFPGMDSVFMLDCNHLRLCRSTSLCCVGLANLYNDGKSLSAENATNKKTSEVVQQENTNTKQVQDKKKKLTRLRTIPTLPLIARKMRSKEKTQEVLAKRKTKVDNVSPGKKTRRCVHC